MKRQNRVIVFIAIIPAIIVSTAFAATDLFTSLGELLREYSKIIPAEKVYVLTDKNVYKPGERIWFSVFLKSGNSHHDTVSSGKIVLYNQFGRRVADSDLHFKKRRSHGFLTLPKPLNEGVYLLGAFTTGSVTDSIESDFYREIIVREKVIPGFILQADLKKDIYQAGGNISLNIRSLNEFNEPVKNVHYRIDMFTGGQLLNSFSFKGGKKNLNLITLRLPEYLNKEQVDLFVYANTSHFTEHLRISLPIENQGAYIRFFPEGGQLFSGISNRLAFSVRDWYGNPIQISGKLVNQDNLAVTPLKSDIDGNGMVDFIPYSEQKYFLKINKPGYLNRIKFPLPEVVTKGVALSLTNIENHTGTFSVLPVGSDAPRILYLTCKSGGDLYWTKKITLAGPVIEKVPGRELADFAVFDEQGNLLGNRLFYTNDHELVITITPDKKEYPPGSKTTLTIKTTDGLGKPVSAKIAISATDHIRMGGRMNEPDINSYFTLFSQLEKPYPLWPERVSEINRLEKQDLVISTSILEKYNWKDVLDRRRHQTTTPQKIIRNDRIYLFDDTETFYSYRNFTGSSYYLASNPGLMQLNKKYRKRTPYYKKLLENGTPLRDVIMVMRPYYLINGGIVFYGMLNSILFQDGALIILDKQKLGTKARLLDDISPYIIESIRISTLPVDIHEFTAFNSVGIIELKTKNGEEKTEEKEKVVLDDMDQTDSVFVSPSYKKIRHYNRNDKDFRTTLYWAPDIVTDADGRAVISYYNSSLRTRVVVTADGMDDNGKTGSAKITYEVK